MILLLMVTLLQPTLQEKEEAMAGIELLLREGAHKKAHKALKTYRRKHAETDEEKEEVDRLIRAAEGGMELDDIAGEYRMKKRPRRTVSRLDDLIHRYRDLPDLLSPAEELRESLRSLYVLEVQDFEATLEVKGLGLTDRDAARTVEDPELVRHGKRSVRWKPRSKSSALDTFLIEEQDWTEYGFFCAWIYSPGKTSPSTQLRISAIEGILPFNWFEAYLEIDWKGWRNVRIPLRGRQGKFRPHGKPSWTDIGRIMIFQEQGPLPELIVDDIRVEKVTE